MTQEVSVRSMRFQKGGQITAAQVRRAPQASANCWYSREKVVGVGNLEEMDLAMELLAEGEAVERAVLVGGGSAERVAVEVDEIGGGRWTMDNGLWAVDSGQRGRAG